MDKIGTAFPIGLIAWSLFCCGIGILISRRLMIKEIERFRNKLKDWRARGYFHPYKRVEITIEDIDAFLRGK